MSARVDCAVVGVACRVPGAESPWQLFANTRSAAVAVGPAPADRAGLPPGGYVRDLSHVALDALGLQPRELRFRDPQHALALEVAALALRDAGGPDLGPIGVAVGSCCRDFAQRQGATTLQQLLGQQPQALPGWVANKLGLTGPALLFDAGQASSLVALDWACQELSHGHAAAMLVVGVNALLDRAAWLPFESAGLLAADHACKPFSAAADGFVRAEGAVALLLRPLAAAERSADAIYGVVRATSVRQGAGGERSAAAPDPTALAANARAALERAGLEAESIGYIEAHGSGTLAGDRAEFNAWSELLSGARPQSCALGSVKSCLGHLEGAGGLAGLVSALMAVHTGQLPAARLPGGPARALSFEGGGLYFNDRPRPWPCSAAPHRAIVGSIGMAGSIAHAVLEAPRRPPARVAEAAALPLILAAPERAQLAQLARDFLVCLQSGQHELPALTLAAARAAERSLRGTGGVVWLAVVRDTVEAMTALHAASQSGAHELPALPWPPGALGSWRELLAACGSLSVAGAPLDLVQVESVWSRCEQAGSLPPVPGAPFARQLVHEPHPRPLAGAAAVPAPAGADLASFLQDMSELCGLEPSPDLLAQSPHDLGLDSIAASTLATRWSRALDRRVPDTLFIDCRTLRDAWLSLAALSDGAPRQPALTGGQQPSTPAERAPAGARDAAPPSSVPIAIVGMAGRFPGARSIPELWQALLARRCALREIPPERWPLAGWYDAEAGRLSSGTGSGAKWGGFLDRLSHFDAPFFRISPREAAWLDPQQRQLLEVAWTALEDAGHAGTSLRRLRVGVFVGASYLHYREQLHERQESEHSGTGNSLALIANRISHFLDARGPSLTVDTACASSLSALHMAAQSLRSGECDLAVVGAVHAALSQRYFERYSRLRALSPSGRVRTFDEAADGYVPGEGVVALVLRRLPDARAGRDAVRALVLGSNVAHGGTTSGITVPNSDAQAELLEGALRAAGVGASSIGLVEAHGTGTPLGDPIEFAALARVFERQGAPAQSCALGSVKTNLGHLEPAAGLAGLVKLVCSLETASLPPSVGLESPNRRLDFPGSAFYYLDRARPWPSAATPRRGLVSAFGIGGAMASCVLEAAPQQEPLPAPAGAHLFCISAASPSALEQLAQRQLEWLRAHPASAIADVCFSLQLGRRHLRARLALVARDHAGLCEQLQRAAAHAAAPSARATALDVRLASAALEHAQTAAWLPHAPRGAAALERFEAALAARGESLPSGACPGLAVAFWLRELGVPVGRLSCTAAAAEGEDQTGGRLARCARALGFQLVAAEALPAPSAAAPQLCLAGLAPSPVPHTLAPVPGIESAGLELLARVYEAGFELDWELLHDQPRQRLSLPTYPFEPQQHGFWPAAAPVDLESELGFFTSHWQVRPATAGPARCSWLLLHPEDAETRPLVDTLARAVAAQGERCTVASAHAELSPAELQAWQEAGLPQLLLMSPACVAGALDVLRAGADAEALAVRVFQLLRQLAKLRSSSRIGALLISPTSIAEAPTAAGLRASAAAGALRSACRELPWLQARHALCSLAGDRDATSLALLNEARCQDPAFSVNLLGAQRQVESWQRRELPPGAYPDQGVWVIAGGTGGIGSAIAADVLRRSTGRVWLLGRQAELPPSLHGLRHEHGERLAYAQCDISRQGEALRVLGEVCARESRIDWLLHCAGLMESVAPIATKQLRDFEAPLSSKLAGTQQLWQAARELQLPRLILFSSYSALSSELGAGVAGYAAGNAFQNAFAEAVRGLPGPRVCSIVWPAWRATGMLKQSGVRAVESIVPALEPEQALAALRAIAGEPSCHWPACSAPFRVAGAALDPRFHERPVAELRESPPERSAAPAGPGPRNEAVLATAAEPALRSSASPLDRTLRILARVLRARDGALGADVEFIELGMDSLMMAETLRALEGETGRALSSSLLLEFPTARLLAQQVFAGVPGTGETQARPALASPKAEARATLACAPLFRAELGRIEQLSDRRVFVPIKTTLSGPCPALAWLEPLRQALLGLGRPEPRFFDLAFGEPPATGTLQAAAWSEPDGRFRIWSDVHLASGRIGAAPSRRAPGAAAAVPRASRERAWLQGEAHGFRWQLFAAAERHTLHGRLEPIERGTSLSPAQLLLGALPALAAGAGQRQALRGIAELGGSPPAPGSSCDFCWRLRGAPHALASADVVIVGPDGHACASAEGVELRALATEVPAPATSSAARSSSSDRRQVLQPQNGVFQ